ncbi:PREDICTED: p21-activated protein kinase-interacting protein 1-like [Priapulus caudatus]|uniref:P21-activated protein kinase-interacting protein 1-like n=1 Tax=Priapulus caudatus TaxID=37621 RepID=A0ABM1ETP9_PRICU|nr:PREDICTED: p21-activated protein kinase-interacting protein 1-like [Priapulus caudatus]
MSTRAVAMELIVGTYEELLLGYRVNSGSNGVTIEPSFTNNAHTGCIKTVAVSPNQVYLVSGGTDETIKIHDLVSRKDYGSLTHHGGTVTDVSCHGAVHMFSGSEDGTICVWGKRWILLKTLKGHKGAVNCVAVHPSGKLALSVGKDKTLRTWDLMKGKQAFVVNLKIASDQVVWSPNGTYYSVLQQNQIEIYKAGSGVVCCTYDFEHRVNVVEFISDSVIAIGGESEDLHLYDITKQQCLCRFTAHSNRIKALKKVESLDRDESVWLASASSDGYLKIWAIDDLKKIDSPLRLVTDCNTTFRLTCLTFASSEVNKAIKQPAEEGEINDQETETKTSDKSDKVTTKKNQRGVKRKLRKQKDDT